MSVLPFIFEAESVFSAYPHFTEPSRGRVKKNSSFKNVAPVTVKQGKENKISQPSHAFDCTICTKLIFLNMVQSFEATVRLPKTLIKQFAV